MKSIPISLSNTVLATQTFFADYWCLRSSLIPSQGRLELGLALIGVYFGSCVLSADDIGKIRGEFSSYRCHEFFGIHSISSSAQP
jgi:hypothetical protein